jgi:hypothetical protein
LLARGASELRLAGASEIPFGRGSETRLADAGDTQPGGPRPSADATHDGGNAGYPPIESLRTGEGGGSGSEDR